MSYKPGVKSKEKRGLGAGFLKNAINAFRDYGKLAEEDIILRTDNKRDENRLTGASVFPTDLDPAENSQHHPWACSLRMRGYRGRHRCGVTLLSGNNCSEHLIS